MIVFESDRPRNEGGRDDGREDVGEPRVECFHAGHDAEREHAQGQGRPVQMAGGGHDRPIDRFVVMIGFLYAYTEQGRQLARRDNDGCGIGEADYHRMGQKVDHHAKLQQSQQELKSADDKREADRVRDVRLATRSGQRV